MLPDLWLPVLLATVAVFFASFLSWMVLKVHDADWPRVKDEDGLLAAVRRLGIAPGSYMFPRCQTMAEMKTPEFQEKLKAGPQGVLTVFPGRVSMGRSLGLTFALFFAVNATLAYLGTIGLPRGAEFVTVFRFFATAALLAYLTGITQYSIWFRPRLTGYVIESVGFAVVTGLIFAGLWPRG